MCIRDRYSGDRRVAEATHSIPHPLPPGAAQAFVTRAMSGKGDEDIWVMDGSALDHSEVLGVISLKPVSYTHLDVYKRQIHQEHAS